MGGVAAEGRWVESGCAEGRGPEGEGEGARDGGRAESGRRVTTVMEQ